MDDNIYSSLSAIAPTFYKLAPRDDTPLPIINYYYILAEPLRRSDNSYSRSKRLVVQIECFAWTGIDDFADRVENEMKTIGGVLRSKDWITDTKAQGISFEFEFFQIVEED